MIQRIETVAKGLDLNSDINKYIERKIGKLDKYMTKHAKKTAHAEVKLKQEKSKSNEKFTCEVIMHLPGGVLTAKEATLNIFAAIDIVEAKLKNQLRKYKDKHNEHHVDKRGTLRKLRKIADKDFWGKQN